MPLPKKPADHGPHSRFFHKVNPFQNLFTKSSHFQFFPNFPKIFHCAPDRVNGAATYALIALASLGRPADDRERPCFRSAPAYANFLLLLAAFYMRLIFPETAPPIGNSGNRKLINSPRFFICFIPYGKLSRRGI